MSDRYGLAWPRITLAWSLLAVVFSVGCGLFGRTRPLEVDVPSPQGSQTSVALRVGTVELEPGQTRLANVGTYAIGEYGDKDIAALQESLSRSVPASPSTDRYAVHVVVRRFLVSHSNTDGLALACVTWALTDPSGALVFHEQFYASDSVHLWGTVGRTKEHVHEGIVGRVLRSASSIAAGGEAQGAPYTHDDFDSAAASLPHSLRSVFIHTAVLGGGYAYRVSTVTGDAELGWARQADHFDWPTRLASGAASTTP